MAVGRDVPQPIYYPLKKPDSVSVPYARVRLTHAYRKVSVSDRCQPPQLTTTGDHGVRAALVGAALEAGLTAWRAGESVETVLTLGGYTRNVIDGVVNYIAQDPAGAAREADTMTPAGKRGRYGGVTGLKKKVPVAPSVKKYVKNCMERLSEKKYVTVTGRSLTNIPTSGSTLALGLEGIIQGTSDSTRTGNMIHTKSLATRLSFSDSSCGWVRVTLVWDHQCNGTLGSVTDVFTAAAPDSTFNANTVRGHGGGRFTIVDDRVLTVQPTVSGATTFVQYNHVWKKPASATVVYNASTGAVTDLTSNNCFIVAISNNGTIDCGGQVQWEYDDN